MSYFMPNTAIERMRARYIADLATSEARSNAIRAKLQVLDELSAEEKQIGVMTAEAPPPSPVSAETRRTTFVLPSGLTDACLAVVEHFAVNRGISTRQVRDQLIANGFPARGKNFTSIVNVTLKRMAGKKRIYGENAGGTWTFRANPERMLL